MEEDEIIYPNIPAGSNAVQNPSQSSLPAGSNAVPITMEASIKQEYEPNQNRTLAQIAQAERKFVQTDLVTSHPDASLRQQASEQAMMAQVAELHAALNMAQMQGEAEKQQIIAKARQAIFHQDAQFKNAAKEYEQIARDIAKMEVAQGAVRLTAQYSGSITDAANQIRDSNTEIEVLKNNSAKVYVLTDHPNYQEKTEIPSVIRNEFIKDLCL